MSDVEWKLSSLKKTVKSTVDNFRKKKENRDKIVEYKRKTLTELEKVVKAGQEQDFIISSIAVDIQRMKQAVERKREQVSKQEHKLEAEFKDKVKKELENLEFLKNFKTNICEKETKMVKIILSLAFLENNFLKKNIFSFSATEIEELIRSNSFKMLSRNVNVVDDEDSSLILSSHREENAPRVKLSELVRQLGSFGFSYSELYNTYEQIRSKLTSMRSGIIQLNDRVVKLEIKKDTYRRQLAHIIQHNKVKIRDIVSFSSDVKDILTDSSIPFKDEVVQAEQIEAEIPEYYRQRYKRIEQMASTVKTVLETVMYE